MTQSPCKGKLLIVDDELIVAADLEMSVRHLGYEVVGVADCGQEAIAAAERFQPNLVLMDIQLRGRMDGITAAAEIQSRLGIPVVFVTANTNADVLARAMRLAPCGLLRKPFRKTDLEAVLRKGLAG